MNLYKNYNNLTICKKDIDSALLAMIETYKNGGKILLCGNGGSCAEKP